MVRRTWKKTTGRVQTALFLLACNLLGVGWAAAFSEETAGFVIKVGDEVCPYRVLGIFVLPGESLRIEVMDSAARDAFTFTADGGTTSRSEGARWTWRAPEQPGLYPVRIERTEPSGAIRLNVFVMIPYDQLEGASLHGYRIGTYPSTVFRNLEVYRPPRGFIEVTPENEATQLSPHFRLGQFVCKQAGGYPRYVVLRQRLLLKLEHLLKVANRQGYPCEGFFIMSGYRTPHYNASIGNVKYSRHQWGDAVDIFIDEAPQDGVMDDLNGDGQINEGDSAELYDLIERLHDEAEYRPFRGGLGHYGSTASHGPFIHVDTRGFEARWGRP